MRQSQWLLGVTACMCLLTGCVDRRFVIESNPPGAVVYRNNQPLGATPVDDHFVYYGDYEFLLVKDGYQTKKVVQHIPPPWYQIFPLDFISENLWPGRIVDVRRFKYDLEPLPMVRSDELLHQAQNLRQRGQAIQPPEHATESPPSFVAPAEPPPPEPPRP